MFRSTLARDVLLVAAALLLLAAGGYLLIDMFDLYPASVKRAGAAVAADEVNSTERRKKPEELDVEGRKPQVLLFADRAAYAEWYRDAAHEPKIELLSPEGIDFLAHRVVAILWGDKPREGHEIVLTSVVSTDGETIVTVETTAPDDDAFPLIVYPGLTVKVPRGTRVKVVVTGGRMRAVPKFFDFEATRTAELEVEVRGK